MAVLRSRSVRMVAIPDILKANAALAFLVSLTMAIISWVVNRLMGVARHGAITTLSGCFVRIAR